MRKKMVVPTFIHVERGTGINIQAEIPTDIHRRLKAEIDRRLRQGQRASVEIIVREIVMRHADDWPRVMDES